MANPEQLEQLRKGVERWNTWRSEHPDEPVDLARANLTRADLTRADLAGANLTRANLTEANLAGANFTEANLAGADLTRANLTQADLAGANLTRADLTRADLTEADLTRANLTEANLARADLTEANLARADLTEAYLARAYVAGADLTEADLTRANVTRANLAGAHLTKANLAGANLTEASLNDANVREANLARANLTRARLSGARFTGAHLTEANLTEANLTRAHLAGAHLDRANLTRANLTGADLAGANFTEANLAEANLTGAILVGTNLSYSTLRGCRVYGISAWDVHLGGAKQTGLVITPADTAQITVDDLEVAQFIYLLLNNDSIRRIIDTITSKVVLILGRFTPEREGVLDALRDSLRAKDYSPIVFDFEKPASRNLTETVRTLAHLARFVIADITDAKSIPQELMAIVPDLPSVPVQPLLLASQQEYGMFEHFRSYPWVLEAVPYNSSDQLVSDVDGLVLAPAERWLEKNRPRARLTAPEP
jgi:uncharacterized protein YjbI with pentapeptide repeats